MTQSGHRSLQPEFGGLSATADRLYPGLRTAVAGVPNFRLGDTAAANAIGRHYHFSTDLLSLVLRVEPHLIYVHARASVNSSPLL